MKAASRSASPGPAVGQYFPVASALPGTAGRLPMVHL